MSNTAQNDHEKPIDAASVAKAALNSLPSGPQLDLTPALWKQMVGRAVIGHDAAWELRDQLMKELARNNFKYHSLFVCSSNGDGGMGLTTEGHWQYAYVTYNGWNYRAFIAY